ncbi:hypothetical protein ACFL2R_01025 [Patescibacteria group bacterium]
MRDEFKEINLSGIYAEYGLRRDIKSVVIDNVDSLQRQTKPDKLFFFRRGGEKYVFRNDKEGGSDARVGRNFEF